MFANRFRYSLVLLMLTAACSGGGGSDAGEGGDLVDSSSDGGGIATRCGVIAGDTLRNPVASSRGEQVRLVSVLDSNAVIVENGAGQTLIKLQGVGGTTGFENTAAEALYHELAQDTLYLFQANGCAAPVIGGQAGTVGSIVTAGGTSFTEELIARKYAGVIETAGSCGEESLADCYAGISSANVHHAFGPARECTTMPLSVRYRSADTDCNGNASITIDNGSFGSVFSIQLRYPDGTDRIVESCEEASCTPLKVQDYIRTGSVTVGCFGAPGNSVALSDINHVSIKREADDHEPPRYCIADPAAAVN